MRIVAGQGTAGLEIVEQLAELGVDEAPVVLVPVGLGGLAAGVSLAVKSLRPDAHVFAVEPELAADTHASLAAGKRTPWPATGWPDDRRRIARRGTRGDPFAHLKRYLDGVLLVSEAQIEDAMAVAAAS